MPARPNAFPNSLHIKGPATFRAHYASGHRETAGALVALAMASPHPHTRIGFSVPNKVGPAHVRNRLRRLLREAFRLSREIHPKNVDVVLLIRPHKEKTLTEYQYLLATLMARLAARSASASLPDPPAPMPRKRAPKKP